MNDKAKEGYSFKDVLGEELELLRGVKVKPQEAANKAHQARLAGLAFSGGGIRSATFNLGVIQALARVRYDDGQDGGDKTGLLSRFDYLSTVSGGGYIGSWLSALLNRQARLAGEQPGQDGTVAVSRDLVDRIQPAISTRPCGFGPAPAGKDAAADDCARRSGFSANPRTSGFPPLEHAAVRYLRRYTNYLSPRLGLSGDMLAIVSLFLRNLVLLQLALISLVAAVLLLPYLAASLSAAVLDPGSQSSLGAWMACVLGVVFMTAALWMWRAVERPPGEAESPAAGTAPGDAAERRPASAGLTAIPVTLCIVASWLFVIALMRFSAGGNLVAGLVFIVALAGYIIAWVFGPDAFHRKYRSEYAGRTEYAVITLVSGLVFAGLVYACTFALPSSMPAAATWLHPAVAFGPPLTLVIMSFAITVHLGIARGLFREDEREWWARIGGFVLLAAAVWAVVFSIALYTPPLFHWLGNGGFALIAAWAGASGTGVALARSAGGDSTGVAGIARRMLMRAAPWLFIGGLALIISYLLYVCMTAVFLRPATWEVVLVLFITSAIFLLICWRLDINIFSAHTLYRNRLVRAYLGASRAGDREPYSFTGFDLKDDLPLAALARQRPVPILNTTINMTGGDDLAWQTRRAASFAFTPRFVGYEAKSSQGVDLGAYRPTREYAAGTDQPAINAQDDIPGLGLGTVLAISGAAASPNMGFNTSPAIAALLTAFNLRLGYWAGNPSLRKRKATALAPEGLDQAFDRASRGLAARMPESVTREIGEVMTPAWKKQRPLLCARPIIAELTGSATAESDWINLSDGGHFDNLGIYELVRRRCRFIVVTDAGCDPKHQFQDLANTIRKCWTDLGVHIFFPELDKLCLNGEDKRFCESHGSFGVIEYPDRESPDDRENARSKERYGLILYLKCSLTKNEFDKYVDIRQYASTNDTFPHQSTGDQFFDENQFEAYRHLGFCVAEQFESTIRDLFDGEKASLNRVKVFRMAREIRAKQGADSRNDP